MDDRTAALVAECKRQEEACLYTSTTLYEWLKSLRWWRIGFVVLPIVLSAVATWKLLEKQPGYEWITGTCALLAGLVPAVYKALRFDVSLDGLGKTAAQFKTLQDRFRQAAKITALSSLDQLERDFAKLMEELDLARAASLTPPERFFRRAQKKIDAGDYDFSVDAKDTSRGS